MSGFLPDIANWALGGGAGDDDKEGNQQGNDRKGRDSVGEESQMTAAELRAQRLARLEQQQQQQTEGTAEPMEIDSKPTSIQKPAPAPSKPAPSTASAAKSANTSSNSSATDEPALKKKKKKTECSPADVSRKQQLKKEMMLKKVLEVTLAGGSVPGDASSTEIDLDGSTEINDQTITDVITTRMSMQESAATTNSAVTRQKATLIAYLGKCHRKASEEIKTLQQAKGTKTAAIEEILKILVEIQKQTVSYAGSCLLVPGLFPATEDATEQLAKCLISSSSDPSTSISFGVSGSPSSSFYYCVCEELLQQDEARFGSIIEDVVNYIADQLDKYKSILDGNADGSALVMLSGLTAVCVHKKAAERLTVCSKFLLPPADSPGAEQMVRPPTPSNINGGTAGLIQMLGSMEHRPYRKRSGPGLERDTVLGRVFRVGVPKNNAAFSPTSVLRQTSDSVNRTFSSQRQQLRVHQQAAYQFIMSLIKGGAKAKGNVMQWFADALLVNKGASAMQPDPSKVSSNNLLLNMSVILLKLCEPFVNDPSKHRLIDPGFVSSPESHRGVFDTSGDNAVTRLGDGMDQVMTEPYNPKNTFIPQCFFLCARSLNFGISPMLSQQENLLRHISHVHWEIQHNNRDIQSDPHFSMLVSKQRSLEVSLYQEEMVTDTLRFCNLIAALIYDMDDEALKAIPEDFVTDVCHIIMSVAKMKSSCLAGVPFRSVFKMVVKLLSARYSDMVRNYNVRARLGDVLFELFLPPVDGDRREVPASVSEDPLAGGRTYLLSDPSAQETLAPSLLLLYGEVEHTGYYDKMNHRAKIASLIKYLWESTEHRQAFRRITQNKESFVKFANGIINETNTLIATVMQKLPEIRNAQEQMRNTEEWGRLSEEQQGQLTSRLEENEREVKSALPLCNKTLQMFGYLNTDADIRGLFLLEELCPRLVGMLLHVLTKLVGSRGLELKVDNPEQYEFRPKEMLRDLCAIFSLFASQEEFQLECARAGCEPGLLRSALKTCRKLNLLTGESMVAFEALPGLVDEALKKVNEDAMITEGAPDEFLDEILASYMKDPVILPSGHYVDRSTITQHLLNDPMDPFSREPMTVNDIKPAVELKARMTAWIEEKRNKTPPS